MKNRDQATLASSRTRCHRVPGFVDLESKRMIWLGSFERNTKIESITNNIGVFSVEVPLFERMRELLLELDLIEGSGLENGK